MHQPCLPTLIPPKLTQADIRGIVRLVAPSFAAFLEKPDPAPKRRR